MGQSSAKVSQTPMIVLSDSPSTSANNTDDNHGTEAEKKRSELEELVAKITIAGIEDVQKAKTRVEKVMFISAIIGGLIAIAFCSTMIGVRYENQESVVINKSPAEGIIAPFPNISVCLPQMRFRHLRELATIPENILQRMKRGNVSIDEVEKFWGENIMDTVFSKRKRLLTVIASKVFDANMHNRPFEETMKMFQPASCSELFSNCTFAGRPFDCCSIAQYIFFYPGYCWYFNIHLLQNTSNSTTLEIDYVSPNKIPESGLSFDIITDKNEVVFEDETAWDGYILHVDAIASAFSSPVSIPAGADAHVELAPPTKMNEVRNCIPTEKLPKLKHFPNYDSRALNCVFDTAFLYLKKEIGCTIPALTYVPENETVCNAELVFFATNLNHEDTLTEIPEQYRDLLENKMHQMTAIYHSGDQCPLPCSRWTYSVWSASYGYIRYSEDTKAAVSRGNGTMSRIRIYFPSSIHHRHNEEKVNLFYLEFCEIGGVFGVYLGFSIVTVVQVVAYGPILLWKIGKKIRVRVDTADK